MLSWEELSIRPALMGAEFTFNCGVESVFLHF